MTIRPRHYTLRLTSGSGPSWMACFSPARPLGLHSLGVCVLAPTWGQGTVWGQERPVEEMSCKVQSTPSTWEGPREEAARKTHDPGRPPVLLPVRATESHGPPDTGVSADLRSLHSGVGPGDLSEPRHGDNGHTEAQHSQLSTEKLQPGPLSLLRSLKFS